jgi:dsDNA-specific endonuclease/ATPase MutS2
LEYLTANQLKNNQTYKIMKNYNQIDMYKTIIEKCSNMNSNLLEQKNVANGESSNEVNIANIESMLQLISVIEIGVNIRQDDPMKIFDFLRHNKNLCKKYRNIGTETNNLGEIKKYQRIIDEIVDPLIDLIIF